MEEKLVVECSEKIEGNLKTLARKLRLFKKASVGEISVHICNALAVNVVHYLALATGNDDAFRKCILDFNKKVVDLAEKSLIKRKGWGDD